MNLRTALIKAAFAIQLVAVPLFAGAAVKSQVVTTTTSYAESSPEKHQVELWLQQHTARVNGHLIGEFGQIGDVTVTYSRETASDGRVHPQAPGDAPPTPLPSNGRPGDTYSVSSCTRGVSQSWSYVFVNNSNGGNWKLVDYKYNEKACSSGGT
ncbi:hypothetical protein RMA73_14095 [Xanthomonas translucens pv. translucens]|jgi:hypothetical protein|uniref:hypothetical protein n=1 Tax=Xanthomonas campestris pv. translucens TaxID=343 RepID=UPI0012967FA9|nr:hypothetical protein [Xanthomonas translucens]MCT8292041.1 hypothetical protein [Xanthomonas translucens pv. translucens]MCT8319443.1 hypothetical protein [Xanthomonas translucens pv. translucens]MQS43138.1 hypothetical protein [Xanthomonas translucens pv. translucens]QSQ37252.1 hypothetical protein ISN32_15810 [Xanthomonas translucens pv. translucens]UII60882.1 hypothetical protein LZE81_02340 [Xanthomonas translucens]